MKTSVRKAVAALVVLSMLLPFASCTKKTPADESGSEEASRSGEKIASESPWYSNEVTEVIPEEITELVKERAKACCRDKDTVKDLDDRSLLIHVSDLFSPAGNLKVRPWNNCIHILHRHNPGVGHADADSLIKLLTSLRSYRSCSRHCSHPYHHNVPCYFCPGCRGYDPQVKV